MMCCFRLSFFQEKRALFYFLATLLSIKCVHSQPLDTIFSYFTPVYAFQKNAFLPTHHVKKNIINYFINKKMNHKFKHTRSASTSLLPDMNTPITSFAKEVFTSLDYGLYWVDKEHRFYQAKTNLPEQVYHPKRPTVIYIHGWQPNTTLFEHRETLSSQQWQAYAQEVDIIRIWKQKDFNVGILYWNQFADEIEVKDAEAKIWSAQGEQGMRWRDGQGVYHDSIEHHHVTDLLLNCYKEALQEYGGPEIRLVGHSLGSQVAIHLVYQLHQTLPQENMQLLPTRIALLDPFFSRGKKCYLNGKTTGEHTTHLVQELIDQQDILFESYRSSWIHWFNFVGDLNLPLLQKTAQVEYNPDFIPITEFYNRHKICAWLYGLSMVKKPCYLQAECKYALSASSSTETVKYWMNKSGYLSQKVYLNYIRESQDSLGPVSVIDP